MAIKGLSDIRRLPRIGKIRLGVKETHQRTNNPYPRAVDYFVCNADQSTPESAAAAFHAIYGDQPRALDVMFPCEQPELFFAQFYRRYGSGTGLLCKSDGETALAVDTETGELIEQPCVPEECEWYAKKHCRHIGTLQFLLPRVPGLGIWQIDTTSYHSIVNLNSAIDFVRNLTGGRIAGIPLKLIVRPKEVTPDGKKKTVYVLDIASEELKLEDILRASTKTPAQILLPELNLNERPDDLIPDAILEPVQQATPPPQPQPAKPPIQATTTKTQVSKTEQIKVLLDLMKASGAGGEITKLILQYDVKDPKRLTQQEIDYLTELFSTPEAWQKRFQEIQEMEQVAASI